MSAKVLSINVSGALKDVPFMGHIVTTGFFKSAIKHAAKVHKLGVEGDAQADLSVHGGLDKAVYFYPHEHYAAWEELLGAGPLPPGSFGENITSQGLFEETLNIGDVLQIGTTVLQVLQPRSPCYKLQVRFNRPDMTALFFRHGKPGWYASVLKEGISSAGDEIVMVERAAENVSIADVWAANAKDETDPELAERVRNLRLLPDFWKQRLSR